jgi:hypothetical protein
MVNLARLHTVPILLERLIDARRADLVERMARDLVEADAFRVEDEAIMLLRFKGYRPVDVVNLTPDARQVAEQSVVATEMAKP